MAFAVAVGIRGYCTTYETHLLLYPLSRRAVLYSKCMYALVTDEKTKSCNFSSARPSVWKKKRKEGSNITIEDAVSDDGRMDR